MYFLTCAVAVAYDDYLSALRLGYALALHIVVGRICLNVAQLYRLDVRRNSLHDVAKIVPRYKVSIRILASYGNVEGGISCGTITERVFSVVIFCRVGAQGGYACQTGAVIERMDSYASH